MKLSDNKRVKIYAFFTLIAVISFVVRRYILFPHFPLQQQITSFFISIAVMSICYETIQFIHDRLNIYMPFQRNTTLRIALQILISLVFILSYMTLLLSFVLRYVPIGANKYIIIAFFAVYIIITLLINSILIASHFITEWKKMLLLSSKLEKEKAQVQYDNLKNQLNPHFLFNSLTSLNSLIYKNPDLASAFLQQLSKVYRYLLQHKEDNLVTLEEELGFVTNYTELLKTRFGKGLEIVISISPETMEKLIVPVSIQVMIENAVKHNITDEESPLKITISGENNILVIRNNIQLKKLVESSNRVGLENFKNLYALFSKEPMSYESRDGYFIVKIPLI